jgi:hypothetical protein
MPWQTTIFQEVIRECFQAFLLGVIVLAACGTWPKPVMTGTLQTMFSVQRLDLDLTRLCLDYAVTLGYYE